MNSSFYSNSTGDPDTQLVNAVQSIIHSHVSKKSLDHLISLDSIGGGTADNWSLNLAKKLMGCLCHLEISETALRLVEHLLNQWSDSYVFALMVYETNEDGLSMLAMLTEAMFNTNTRSSNNISNNGNESENGRSNSSLETAAALIMICVSRIWQVLERQQEIFTWQRHCPDAWWIQQVSSSSSKCNNAIRNPSEDEWIALAHRIVDRLAPITQQSIGRIPRTDRFACTSLLSSMIQYEICDWVSSMPTELMRTLVDNLIHDCHCWASGDGCSTSSSSSASHISKLVGLGSIRLLTLIQWKAIDIDMTQPFEQLVVSTSLVECVVQVAFSSSFQYQNTDTELRFITFDVLRVWHRTESEAWACMLALEGQWESFLGRVWRCVISPGKELSVVDLQALLLLHKTSLFTSKQTIGSILSDTRKNFQDLSADSSSNTLESLFCRPPGESTEITTLVMALLRHLLNDRQSSLKDDQVCGLVWEAFTKFPISNILRIVSNCVASSDQTKRGIHLPLKVCLLDILDLALTFLQDGESNNNDENNSINTSDIEMLVDVLSTGVDTMRHEPDDETPQANNLSRLVDDSHIFDFDEKEEGPAHRKSNLSRSAPLDVIADIAAATCLVRYSRFVNLDESQLVEGRIRGVVSDFVVDFASSPATRRHTFEITWRSFRLNNLVASVSDEDEETIVRAQQKVLERYQQDVASREENVRSQMKQIKTLTDTIETLKQEKAKMQQRLKAQEIITQRSIVRARKSASRDSTRAASHHLAERKRSETREQQARQQLVLTGRQYEEAEKKIEVLQASHVKLESELQGERTKLNEVQKTLQEHEHKVKSKDRELREMQQKVHDSHGEAREAEERLQDISNRLMKSEENLRLTNLACQELGDEVDGAYGGLIVLAQAYQAKEDDLAQSKGRLEKKLEDSRRKVEAERRRNDELEEANIKFQRDNERLIAKLSRAKEKYEEERKKRHEQETDWRRKRAPISYINQLHTSATSEASKSRRKFPGKENK